jgi:CBS-domain-containing membrane protein
MTVKEVMTKPVATCRLDTKLAEATALMWENNCGILPVLNETGELAGVVTDRDLCIALGTRNVRSAELCVRDVVNSQTQVCKANDEIHTALWSMSEEKIRRLPVVNDDAMLEGIVSMDDVVLNAQNDARADSAISFGDVVTTLQAIYSRDDRGQGAVA